MTNGPFHDWTIPRELWDELRPMLRAGMLTLECGSGLSTLLFDAAGCRHTALEHDRAFAAPSDSVVLVPLAGAPPWYDWEPTHPYDLILVDGPPQHSGGRDGIMRVFGILVHPTTVVILDDTNRPAERRLADTICRQFQLRPTHYMQHERGFSILTP
jgi:hypothetical protein